MTTRVENNLKNVTRRNAIRRIGERRTPEKGEICFLDARRSGKRKLNLGQDIVEIVSSFGDFCKVRTESGEEWN